MNVKELIERLGHCDPAMEVVFAYDYGDRQHTSVTQVVGDVDQMMVKPSEYFRKRIIVDNDDDVPKDAVEVVVLG